MKKWINILEKYERMCPGSPCRIPDKYQLYC